MALEDMMDLLKIRDLEKYYDNIYLGLFGEPITIGVHQDGMFSCISSADRIIHRNSILADENLDDAHIEAIYDAATNYNRPVEERAKLLLGIDDYNSAKE